MYIKNRSKKEWLQYNCGDSVKIDIKAESTFEVDDKYGEVLLRNLGCDAWLVKTAAPVKEEKKVKEVKKEEVKEVKKEEVKKSFNKFKK